MDASDYVSNMIQEWASRHDLRVEFSACQADCPTIFLPKRQEGLYTDYAEICLKVAIPVEYLKHFHDGDPTALKSLETAFGYRAS